MKISEFVDVKKFKFIPEDKNTNDVRLRELDWLAPYIGDWGYNLEFGVFNGVTISCLATARPDLEFHGFDSFEGLPSDWDMGSKHVKADAFDRKGVMPEVPDNVKLWKGWFSQTIMDWLIHVSEEGYTKPHLRKNISFLHVDCDVYSSTKTVLDDLNKWIVPGTIIRFDELSCWRNVFKEASPTGPANRVHYTTWRDHEWKAMNEWLETFDRKIIPISRNWFQGATVMVTQ
jgi:hypothetical protein